MDTQSTFYLYIFGILAFMAIMLLMYRYGGERSYSLLPAIVISFPLLGILLLLFFTFGAFEYGGDGIQLLCAGVLATGALCTWLVVKLMDEGVL